MNYSFSTVLAAILISNLLLIILTQLLRHSRIMITAGYKILLFIVLLAAARLLFPFEFPFAINIYFPQLLSKVISNFRQPRFEIHGYLLSLWNFFEILWIMGVLVYTGFYVYTYYQFRKTIFQMGTNITGEEKYSILLDEICRMHKVKNNFQVYQLPNINTPMIFGMRKPYILIPETLDTTSKELYYILCHETAHYFRHDLAVKFFIQMLCMVYWWNPACVLLKKHMNLLLEMRVDEYVTSKDAVSKAEYLECLLQIVKSSVPVKDFTFTISLCSENRSLLTQRFQMMINRKTGIHKSVLDVVLFISTVIIFSMSYLFTLESNYIPQEIASTTIVCSADNTYLVQNPDGTYDIYFGFQYIETVDSLKYYDEDLCIYQSIQEAQEIWKN